MTPHGPERTFLGLPLLAEQEAVIRHYLYTHRRTGLPFDKRELRAMIADMLVPPVAALPDEHGAAELAHADAERAAALVDDCVDSMFASEERIAHRESEAMKHPAV